MKEKWQMSSGECHYDQIFSAEDDRVAGDNWSSAVPRLSVQSSSLADLLIEICRANGWTYSPDCWDVTGDGKIQMVFQVNADGSDASSEDVDEWYECKRDLYDLTVDISVEKIAVTVPSEYDLVCLCPNMRGR